VRAQRREVIEVEVGERGRGEGRGRGGRLSGGCDGMVSAV